MLEHTPALHVDLDAAWTPGILGLPQLDLRARGKSLRFCTTRRRVEEYAAAIASRPARFRLYGSGDFHHLTAIHLRDFAEPFTLVSFDNHPDWDRRPPLWQCGAWINRALELPLMERIHLWGCTSPDAHWPGRIFADPRALRAGRVRAHLADVGNAQLWRESFGRFVAELAGKNVFVTVDLDCLSPREVITNWDAGSLDSDSLVFALRAIRENAASLRGDVCGGWSAAHYERRLQRWAAAIDHPKLALPAPEEIASRNERTLRKVWTALTGEDEPDSDRDQRQAQDQPGR